MIPGLPNPRILCLDQGATTGWAFFAPGFRPQHGSHRFMNYGADVGGYLVDFDVFLHELIDVKKVNMVVIEQVFVGGGSRNPIAMQKLFGLPSFIEYVCAFESIKCVAVENVTWLKHFTGNGGGKTADRKARTKYECRKRGFNVQDEHEADAIGIMDYTADLYGLKKTWPGGNLNFNEKGKQNDQQKNQT